MFYQRPLPTRLARCEANVHEKILPQRLCIVFKLLVVFFGYEVNAFKIGYEARFVVRRVGTIGLPVYEYP